MLHFTENYMIGNFLLMLFQNVVPQNKMKKLFLVKKCSYGNLNGMFRLHLFFFKQLVYKQLAFG